MNRLSIKDITFLGMQIALLEVSKLMLDPIPNVELISLLLIIFTIYFGKKTLIAAVGFTALECFVFGVSVWTLMYLYVWPILILAADLLRGRGSRLVYCILSGIFGLFFGALCSLPYIFISGLPTVVSWWITGLPYDLIHGCSNFVIMLVLYKPLRRVMDVVVERTGL